MPRKGVFAHRTCVVCGASFPRPPSSETICCSPECSSIRRRQLYDAGVYRETMERMAVGRAASPLLKPGPSHTNAKEWVILSPTGTIYRCRNLLHWCREHEDLLDGTPHQAWDGLTKIKYTAQGKRPRAKSKSWKGWTLLDWGD